MIRVSLADSLGLPRSPRLQVYRLAAGRLGCDLPLEALAPDKSSSAELCLLPPESSSVRSVAAVTGIRDCRRVRGWLGGAMREVVCCGGEGAYVVQIEGIGDFAISGSSPEIRCLSLQPGLPRQRVEEVLLGPPVALALALMGTWCLHASAVRRAGRATLLLGNSGRGKSTLARFCDGYGGFTRIADDIVPCSLGDASAWAHPLFPQLKLPLAERYPAEAPPTLAIDAMVFLDSGRYDDEIGIDRIVPTEALHRAAGQTVAIGLFDRWLHERHLRFVARMLAAVPAYVVRYPHDYERLPEVCVALIARPAAA